MLLVWAAGGCNLGCTRRAKAELTLCWLIHWHKLGLVVFNNTGVEGVSARLLAGSFSRRSRRACGPGA